MSTKAALRERARDAYQTLFAVSTEGAEEARLQVGLPVVWVWDSLTVQQLQALAVACRVRLLEIQGAP